MADRREFLGTGVAFPVRIGPGGGLMWSAGESLVAESMWQLLATAPGERLMRPQLGCGIHDLLFANDTAATEAAVAHNVRQALISGEPRIDVLDVRVGGDGDLGNVVTISIDYRIRENNAVHNLVYPLFVTEGQR
ncbi:MAG: GPW/gp25 family protein [Ilumatobacteraceae bacterium]